MNAILCAVDSIMLHAHGSQILREMPCMQVHARLQQIVLEKYHPKRMRVAEPSTVHTKKSLKDIEVLVTEDVNGRQDVKFNLQQTWMLQSPSTYRDAYGFRRALMGDNYNSPSSELCVLKYPSLVFVNYNPDAGCASGKDLVKCKPFMNAEDVVKFLLSVFARRGQYDEIFEDDDGQGGPNADRDQRREVSDDHEWRGEPGTLDSRGPESHKPEMVCGAEKSEWKGPPELVKIVQQSYGLPATNDSWRMASTGTKHVTAQDNFMQSCITKIDLLQKCFSERASIASDECSARKKKRKIELANAATENIANILLDANAMLYNEAMEENS